MAAPLINFTGLASGIDSEALIKAISDVARKVKIAPLEKKIEKYDDENTKLEELKDLLTAIKDLTDEYRTVNGGALSKLANSSDETVATASATNTANNTNANTSTWPNANPIKVIS